MRNSYKYIRLQMRFELSQCGAKIACHNLNEHTRTWK